MTKDVKDDTIDFAKARLSRSTDMLHSESRALFSYWDQLRNGRKLPYRAEIDPREMDCDARHLFILESLGAGNIRFRLAGTSLVDAFGMELRGMSVRAIMNGKARESMTALVEETLAEPGIGYARLSVAGDQNSKWEILFLPLKSEFGQVDRIIGALHRIETRSDAEQPSSKPLHFDIEEMNIRPVTAQSGRTEPKRRIGFAEEAQPFISEKTVTGHLTAIEGGLSARDERSASRPRPALKLVTDD